MSKCLRSPRKVLDFNSLKSSFLSFWVILKNLFDSCQVVEKSIDLYLRMTLVNKLVLTCKANLFLVVLLPSGPLEENVKNSLETNQRSSPMCMLRILVKRWPRLISESSLIPLVKFWVWRWWLLIRDVQRGLDLFPLRHQKKLRR